MAVQLAQCPAARQNEPLVQPHAHSHLAAVRYADVPLKRLAPHAPRHAQPVRARRQHGARFFIAQHVLHVHALVTNPKLEPRVEAFAAFILRRQRQRAHFRRTARRREQHRTRMSQRDARIAAAGLQIELQPFVLRAHLRRFPEPLPPQLGVPVRRQHAAFIAQAHALAAGRALDAAHGVLERGIVHHIDRVIALGGQQHGKQHAVVPHNARAGHEEGQRLRAVLQLDRAPPRSIPREQHAVNARLFNRTGQSARDFAAVIVGKARADRRGNAQHDGIARRRVKEDQRILFAGKGQSVGICHHFVLPFGPVQLQMKS